jgi:hypothetical protein
LYSSATRSVGTIPSGEKSLFFTNSELFQELDVPKAVDRKPRTNLDGAADVLFVFRNPVRRNEPRVDARTKSDVELPR